MPTLDDSLKLNNCPHCSVDYPNLTSQYQFNTAWDNGHSPKKWGVYVCKRCGGAVLAQATPDNNQIVALFPANESAHSSLPEKVREYLNQAMRTVSAPVASVMVCASAIDAMLKEKGYPEGNLYGRIKKAVEEHVLTEEMGKWAHQVRLEANEQRHADDGASLPTIEDAKRLIEFAKILGEILFVLPAKVSRGIAETDEKTVVGEIGGQPKALKLPDAYRNSGYAHTIDLEDSDHKPKVTAKLYYAPLGALVGGDVQPGELIVTNREGNPRWWSAELVIANCKKLPSTGYVEILVDEQVRYAGSLSVSLKTKS